MHSIKSFLTVCVLLFIRSGDLFATSEACPEFVPEILMIEPLLSEEFEKQANELSSYYIPIKSVRASSSVETEVQTDCYIKDKTCFHIFEQSKKIEPSRFVAKAIVQAKKIRVS